MDEFHWHLDELNPTSVNGQPIEQDMCRWCHSRRIEQLLQIRERQFLSDIQEDSSHSFPEGVQRICQERNDVNDKYTEKYGQWGEEGRGLELSDKAIN